MGYLLGMTCVFYWELVGIVGLLKASHRIHSYNLNIEKGCWELVNFCGLHHFMRASKMGISQRSPDRRNSPAGAAFWDCCMACFKQYNQCCFTPNFQDHLSTFHFLLKASMVPRNPLCQWLPQDYVVYLGISGSPSRSQLEVVPLARTQMTIPAGILKGSQGSRRR